MAPSAHAVLEILADFDDDPLSGPDAPGPAVRVRPSIERRVSIMRTKLPILAACLSLALTGMTLVRAENQADNLLNQATFADSEDSTQVKEEKAVERKNQADDAQDQGAAGGQTGSSAPSASGTAGTAGAGAGAAGQ
jgi:hypothetical protein